jgi:hypothetical protein
MHELGTFAVVYPCWAIAHKDSIARDANNKPIGYTSPMKFMILDDKSGGSTFPAFTDADLADRFLKTQENGGDFKIVAKSGLRRHWNRPAWIQIRSQQASTAPP